MLILRAAEIKCLYLEDSKRQYLHLICNSVCVVAEAMQNFIWYNTIWFSKICNRQDIISIRQAHEFIVGILGWQIFIGHIEQRPRHKISLQVGEKSLSFPYIKIKPHYAGPLIMKGIFCFFTPINKKSLKRKGCFLATSSLS